MEPNSPNPNAAGQPLAYCRTCGRPLTLGEQVQAFGTVYCSAHVPSAPEPGPASPFQPASNFPPANPAQPGNPYAGGPQGAGFGQPLPFPGQQPPLGPPAGFAPGAPGIPGGDTSVSPFLAFLLGLVPGVGAIYNGQFAKGVIHVLIFAALVALADNDNAGGFFGLLVAFWTFYMAFEAYHTARKRLYGLPTEEFSGLFATKGNKAIGTVAPVALILLGLLFLLNNLGLLPVQQLTKFWPVLLIVAGGWMIYVRMQPDSEPAASANPNASFNPNPSPNPGTPFSNSPISNPPASGDPANDPKQGGFGS